MKLSLSFLLFVAVFQFGSSNVISKSGTQEQLLSDTNAVQNGSDVIMVIPGPLDVILDVDEFIFGFCSMKCNGDFLVCYEPDSSGENVLDSCDTKCCFYITTLDDTTSFMEPISSENFGVEKSDQCFEVKMKNGATSVLSSERGIASPETYAPKVENGIAKLNIMNTISECSVSGKNAIIKPETTTAPPTITRLGKLGRTSSGKNGHASAATTDEPGSFFDDYWWIFSIFGLILIAIGIGVGVYCYLRSKKKSQKPIPTRQRKLLESQSPVVSKETQKGKTESAVRPDSLFQQSFILSHKSLLYGKKEELEKEKLMPLSRMKQQLLHQQHHYLNNLIKLHLVKMDMHLQQQPMNQKALLQIIGGFFQSLVLPSSPLVLELASTVIFDVKRRHKNLFQHVVENFKRVNPLLF